MVSWKNRQQGDHAAMFGWSHELFGAALIGIGLIVLLSVLSYTPADLPVIGIGGAFASGAEPQMPRENFIGSLGVLIGLTNALLAGKAAILIPLILIWFGTAKLIFRGRLQPRLLAGFVLVLMAGTAFLHAGWAHPGELPGVGGVLGKLLADLLLLPVIGKVGTLILCGGVYAVAMILLAGHRPIRFFRELGRLVWEKIESLRARGRSKREQSVREDRFRVEQTARRQTRRKATVPASDVTAQDGVPKQAELALREVPKPQIIDASRQNVGEIRPGEKPFQRRKKPGHPSLSVEGYEDYDLPGFDILDPVDPESVSDGGDQRAEMLGVQNTIVETLRSFGIETTPGDITKGPTITRYEIYPSVGLRVSRITQLEADIARATCAERINILAPIPGKDTVGIELANSQRVAVPLRELLQDTDFRSAKKKIPLALGKDVYGKTVIGDLAAMPHLLVAGATGAGKSVAVNSMIASMLFKFGPDELRFIMIDPKVVEMQLYNRLPHLVVPVVTDPKKVVAALNWVVNEMERRYRIFAKCEVRNFDSFNNRVRPEAVEKKEEVPPAKEEEVDMETIESIARALEEGELGPEEVQDEMGFHEDEIPDKFPYIVVIIDELADLMQTAPAEVEMNIARIAQKARAAGIHLIVATQTPRADVVTGIIKANIPSRIAFQVSSQLDSRVILDSKGAEKLVGKGDMLYLPPGSAKLVRAQGAFVSDAEVERLVEHCSQQAEQNFEENIRESIESAAENQGGDDITSEDEEMLERCIEVVRQEEKCSTSLLQRRLRLGYTRAARMVDILEQRGLVGPGDGAKAREVFLK